MFPQWPDLPFQAISLIGPFVVLVGYLLFRLALPRPIPGIPYNKHSAMRLLGDVPDMLRWQRERSEMLSFLTAQTTKLKSPIVQVFMRPFGRPCKSSINIAHLEAYDEWVAALCHASA